MSWGTYHGYWLGEKGAGCVGGCWTLKVAWLED
ncbi:unnamed protein product, partial [marine sediment metagenome]